MLTVSKNTIKILKPELIITPSFPDKDAYGFKVTSAAQKINPKVESVFNKCTVPQILKRLLDFILSVHDKRAMSGDRLF
jgi:hypothetical protein